MRKIILFPNSRHCKEDSFRGIIVLKHTYRCDVHPGGKIGFKPKEPINQGDCISNQASATCHIVDTNGYGHAKQHGNKHKPEPEDRKSHPA